MGCSEHSGFKHFKFWHHSLLGNGLRRLFSFRLVVCGDVCGEFEGSEAQTSIDQKRTEILPEVVTRSRHGKSVPVIEISLSDSGDASGGHQLPF